MAQFTIKERTTAKYTAKMEDENAAGIPAASFTTLTLTLYNVADGAIINSRNDQNILNQNGVTVDGAGNLTWIMDPADNIIVDTNKLIEHHIALFKWTYSGGSKRGHHEVNFSIVNLAKVTT